MENTINQESEKVTEETKAEHHESNVEDHPEEQVEAKGEAHEDLVEEEVAEAEQKHEEVDYKEKYYYLLAEMQNMQKRTEKEKESLRKYGNEKILNDLVDVIDNFERTLSFIKGDEDEKVKNIAIGIEMINKQFIESLEKHGLKQIEALGKEFDPNFHEALAQQPAEGKKDMEVIQVHQNGYTLNERLIRPAKVIVAKN
jgi:molecular chaperone GrpE